VPLLFLVRSSASGRRLFGIAYLAGLVFFLAAVQWMRVADPRMYFTWISLSIYCAVYFPVGVLLVRRLDRRTGLPLVLTLPVVWTALEYLRSVLMGGFAWYLLGYSQHAYLPLIQFVDVTGIFGVSFLVAAVNAVAFEWLYRRVAPADAPTPSGKPALVFQSALLLLVLAGALLYGSRRLAQDEFAPGPRLALLQGSVPQGVRNRQASSDEATRADAKLRISSHYDPLSDLAAAGKPDLIIWPETSWPDEWDEIPASLLKGRLPATQVEVGREAVRCRAPLLVGMNANVFDEDSKVTRYNAAILVGRDGKYVGRYDKIHRVPFGEYVPLRETFPWMDRFAPYDFDYSIRPGAEQVRLPLGPYCFGVFICYESADPTLPRGYVNPAAGRKADFLVNISNDGWFDGTCEHEEHLALCRIRAIECRRSVVRAVNMGISAVIDGNGRVLAPEEVAVKGKLRHWDLGPPGQRAPDLPEGRWGEFKKVPGVLFATVPLDDRTSLYARWGDWLPAASLVGLLALLVVSFFRRPPV
jgi:apolipoprotein N-acyltransferase